MRDLLLTLLLTVLWIACPACNGGDDDDVADDDVADDDTGDDDTTAGDDDDTVADDDTGDDDSAAPIALAGHSGEAIVDETSYDGWEELFIIADEGDGEDLCRIRYDLDSVAPRDDCDLPLGDCAWGHDLVLSDVVIVAESDVGCAGFGYDATALAALEEGEVSYAYIPEYSGHPDVMAMYDEAGAAWQVVAFASWDAGSGAFAYTWEDGYPTY